MRDGEQRDLNSALDSHPGQVHGLAVQGPLLRPRLLLQGLALSMGVGLFLGILGPYGSYQNPGLLDRVAYWIASIMAGLGLYAGPLVLLRSACILHRGGALFWIGVIAGTAFLSLFQTLITRDLALTIWPEIAPHLPGWWIWYVQVLAIALPGVLGVLLWRRYRDKRAEISAKGDVPRPQEPVTPEISQPESGAAQGEGLRIGTAYPRPEHIHALQMEDHYIRCYVADGSRLVHGVFRDAVARQSGCDGLQVHRSWWVARHAVSRWEGTPRALRLHLSNGLEVPVARAQVARLREAGWLDKD